MEVQVVSSKIRHSGADLESIGIGPTSESPAAEVVGVELTVSPILPTLQSRGCSMGVFASYWN